MKACLSVSAKMIQQSEDMSRLMEYLMTHPSPQNRLEKMKRWVNGAPFNASDSDVYEEFD
jgi:predicted Zn-dependent protease